MAFNELFDAAMSFPAVLFTFLLVVVVVYWLLVMIGGAVFEGPDGDGPDGGGGFMAAVGLGGVPVSIVLSLLIAQAWFVSLVGTVLLDDADIEAPLDSVISVGTPVAAILLAWLGTSLIARPIRRVVPNEPPPSRLDFVGSVCVVRTGQVDAGFGQAEVTAADGSSALIQVRQNGDDELRAGSTALIYDYDADNEVFWVTAFDPELGMNI